MYTSLHTTDSVSTAGPDAQRMQLTAELACRTAFLDQAIEDPHLSDRAFFQALSEYAELLAALKQDH